LAETVPASLHVFIYGRVQGVYFREFTRRHADRLGIKGWVRNLRDGSVEVIAEGPKDKLEQLLERLRLGPPGARTEDVKVEWGKHTGAYGDFSVTR
jgi:acylphosphatase